MGTNLDLIKVLLYAIMKLKANEKGRTPDYKKKKRSSIKVYKIC